MDGRGEGERERENERARGVGGCGGRDMKRSYEEEYSESSVREQCTEILCVYSSSTKTGWCIFVLIFICRLLPCSVISFSYSVRRKKRKDECSGLCIAYCPRKGVSHVGLFNCP